MTAMAMDHELWVRHFHPAPDAAIRLVCLPHAGGSASFYFPLSRRLSGDLDVVAIQYPGRQDRRHEPCVDDLRSLAVAVFEALRPLADRAIALFGHSLGATLGFEIARLFERTGVTPAHLFASGRAAPSRPRPEQFHLDGEAALLSDIRRLAGTDSRILGDEEILRMALPAIRADYKAAETYRYQPAPPLSCPITAFAGDADPKATVDEVGAWADHTNAGFRLRVFPGGHFFLAHHQEAIVRAIADACVPA
jgi:surfactin synthase thioesterase subunit